MIEKPVSVAASKFKSAKWDEIIADRNFSQSDIPTLTLLCQWHQVVYQCMNDLDYDGEIRIAYQNDLGDIKAFPQLAIMKQASAEIRALNKQLGINDEVRSNAQREVTPLYVIKANREARAAHKNNTKAC